MHLVKGNYLMLAGISVLLVLALSNDEADAACRTTYLQDGVYVESDVLSTGTETTINCSVPHTTLSSQWSYGDKDDLLSTSNNCSDSATFVTPSNGVLVLCSPSVSEAGLYFFGYTYTVQNTDPDNQTETSDIITIRLYSAPKLDSNPVNQETTVDSSASLSCSANGKPEPQIVWMQNGMVVNDSRRVVTSRLESLGRSSTMSISKTRYEDRSLGPFTCLATSYRPDGSAIGNVTSSGALIRVRNPLDPLWPALGLIGQIIIMALMVYCTRRDKNGQVKGNVEVVYTTGASSTRTDGAASINDRGRRLSEQYRGDVPLLARTNSSSPPQHGYSV